MLVISRIITCSQFCCLLGGVLALGKLLPSPMEALADSLPKHLLFGWWSSPMQHCEVLEEALLTLSGYSQH